MMNHRLLTLFLLMISFSFLSCEKSSQKNKKEQQVLKLNFNSDPPTLDPRKGGDIISSTMQFMLFEGLTRMTPQTTTEPAMAKSIDISEDKKTYTFHLRDCKWSDGTSVTAEDFEQAWKDMLTPGFPCPNAHLLYPIKNAELAKKGECSLDELGIKATDEKTFVVTLEKPTPYFLELTSFCVFFPVPKAISKSKPKWADKATSDFVSNGPFILTKWKKADELIVKKNPQYWDLENVNLSRIEISFVENEMTALQLYEKNELDMLGSPFSEIPIDSIPTLLKKGLIKTKPIAGTTICPFNINKFPFENLNMRKAFAYSINRQEIVDHITQLDEKVASGTLPPILKGGKETQFFPDGDLQMAKDCFAKALNELNINSDQLETITIIYPHSEINQKIVQAIQQQWYLALGIQIKMEGLDFRLFLDRLVRRDYQVAQFMWVAQYNDAMNILDRYKFKGNPKNYSGWENEKYISALDNYLSATTEEQRISYMEEAEHIFVSDMPVATLFHWNYAYLQKDYLKNVYISPIGSIHLWQAFIDHSNNTEHLKLATYP